MTKCRKPFGHLLTSFDIFEKIVGGVNGCEIFLWILWTADFSFRTGAHTETENHSKQIESKISRSLTPPTYFSKMSKDVKRCQKMSTLWTKRQSAALRSLKGGSKRRSRFTKRAVSEKSSEIGVWAFIVWDRGTAGQSNRPHVFERSCNRPIPLYESTNSVVYNSRTEMTVTLRALRQ